MVERGPSLENPSVLPEEPTAPVELELSQDLASPKQETLPTEPGEVIIEPESNSNLTEADRRLIPENPDAFSRIPAGETLPIQAGIEGVFKKTSQENE